MHDALGAEGWILLIGEFGSAACMMFPTTARLLWGTAFAAVCGF